VIDKKNTHMLVQDMSKFSIELLCLLSDCSRLCVPM